MIGWLQGQLQDPWQQANRCGLLLICHGVGYELQVSPRLWAQLPPPGSELTFHVHHAIRDDGWMLYGFASRHERELFRELVAVSGVGPQMGLALLGAMAFEELVGAIVEGDLRLLSQAPGVGKRTAERIALELRQKVLERFGGRIGVLPGGDTSAPGIDPPRGVGTVLGDELQGLLLSMGYERMEIHSALRAVAPQGFDPATDGERVLGDCLRWLSRSAA